MGAASVVHPRLFLFVIFKDSPAGMLRLDMAVAPRPDLELHFFDSVSVRLLNLSFSLNRQRRMDSVLAEAQVSAHRAELLEQPTER